MMSTDKYPGMSCPCPGSDVDAWISQLKKKQALDYHQLESLCSKVRLLFHSMLSESWYAYTPNPLSVAMHVQDRAHRPKVECVLINFLGG